MAEDIMAALDKVIGTYKAGGDFATGRAESLKGKERKYTAGAQQGLVSRGLSGTTIAASIPAAFEQDVAAPFRTQTEQMRSAAEMQGLLAKAGFLSADEERAMRERLAASDIASREKIAAGDQRSRVQAAANRGPAATMSTFASREAERKARLADRDSATPAPAGPTQHAGAAGSLDFGIDYGSTGGTGGAAAPTAAPLMPEGSSDPVSGMTVGHSWAWGGLPNESFQVGTPEFYDAYAKYTEYNANIQRQREARR
jgi:hypothetical protein